MKTKYIRIDGQTSMDKRHVLIKEFQNNEDIRIAILSITSSSLGVNLTAASHVIFA